MYSSCRCTGFEDSAVGKDQLNNQIPDRSILKTMSIKISFSGPRRLICITGSQVVLDLQGVLQDNYRKCVAMFNICHFLTCNYVPNSGMKKTKCISVHIQITDFSYK